MKSREFYHTNKEYKTQGLEPLLDHISTYLNRRRTVPVSKTSSISGPDITFTFSDPLLKRFLKDTHSLKKPYETAIKHGFLGYSKGGRNGIFYQRGNDRRLTNTTDSLAETHKQEVLEDLNISEKGLDALKKVKIVWHNPSGERVVGLYNHDNHRILFLGFASY